MASGRAQDGAEVAMLARPDAAAQPRSAAGAVAGRQLLDRPAVAVRVREEQEAAPRVVLDAAVLDALCHEVGLGRLDVGDDQLQAFERTRPGAAEPGPERDRAAGPWRRDLDEAKLVADAVVVVDVE